MNAIAPLLGMHPHALFGAGAGKPGRVVVELSAGIGHLRAQRPDVDVSVVIETALITSLPVEETRKCTVPSLNTNSP